MGKSGDKEAAVRKEIIAGITRVYEETAKAAKAAKLACPIIATGHLSVKCYRCDSQALIELTTPTALLPKRLAQLPQGSGNPAIVQVLTVTVME